MLRHSLFTVALYLLSGALFVHATQFLEAPQFTTGTNPQAVTVGDFNGDGIPDVAVANATSNTVSILIGTGNGTFKAKQDYATGTTPEGVIAADFNGDGKLDLAVTNSASNTVSILLGNGNGSFQAKIDYATGRGPDGIAGADLNSDTHIDLVVTNGIDGTVGVLIGNGDGTFKKQVTYNTGFNPAAVVIADFNGDGKLDLATANNNVNANNLVSVLLGKGDGTFNGQLQYGTGNGPISIAAMDLNGDGKLDLVLADHLGNSVDVLLGNGDGSFKANVNYNTAAFPTSVALGDFNGDGHPDIAVSAGDGNTLSVLLGRGDGTFTAQINYGVGNIPYAVTAADLNGDGKIDLVVANSGSNNVSAVLGNGDGTFQTRIDYPAGANPNWVAAGDFNGDGFADLAVANSDCTATTACSISILLGKGDGTFQAPTHYSAGTGTLPYSVATADLNGDGILDLAIADYGTGSVSVMLGSGQNGVGDGTFPNSVDYAVGAEPTSVAIADVNGDGKPDLIVSNFYSNTISVLLGSGTGTFTAASSSPATGKGPVSLAVGDFNGDGKADIVVVNETDNNVSILLGNGNGTFAKQVVYPIGTGGNPLSVTVGDFNGDNKLDLAIADFLAQKVSVLLGNGNGTFQSVIQYPTGANPSSVVAGDFNGDGKLDLALTSTPVQTSPGSLMSLLYGNGDGTFQAPVLFSTGSQLTSPFGSAALADFNGDGARDLAVANGNSNTVTVLINGQGTKLSVASSGNPSVYGQPVTFTASISASIPEAGVPSGTVTIKNGSVVLGSGSISDGTFAASAAALSTGADAITAVYSGDANFQAHTVNVTQTVNQAGSSTMLISSANPAPDGLPVTLTASVSSSTTGVPTGSVNFFDGTSALGSSPLNSGVATLPVAGLAIGTHTLTASYSGDTNFATSTSPVVNQVVGKASSNTQLSSSSTAGNLTLTATISGSPGAPTGSVNFMDGSAQLGSANVNANGVATFSTTALSAGTHSITASYTGDGNFAGSSSSALSVTADFGLAVSNASATSVSPGQSATSTITISPTNGFNASTVTFTCSISPSVTPAPTCSVGAISAGNGSSTATLTVTTVANSKAASLVGDGRSGWLVALGILIPILILGLSVSGQNTRRRLASLAAVAVIAGCTLLQSACGGGVSTGGGSGSGQTGTPSGNYSITVTGSANGVQHKATMSLTVN